MEKKEAFQKVAARNAVAKPQKKHEKERRTAALVSETLPRRKRVAPANKKSRGPAQSARRKEGRTSNVEDAAVSSDTDSDDGADELQFVGGTNSGGSDSDTNSSSGAAEKEVSATFELFDPQDDDASSLLQLIRHSRVYGQLGLQPQQLRQLAEVMAGQGNIGSVARATTEGEGRSAAAVGVTTLISLRQYPEAMGPLASKILSLAQANASDKTTAELRKLLALGESRSSSKPPKHETDKEADRINRNAGLFISCRFANLPLEVAAEAAEALAEDVRWSLTTPEMDEEERPWYRFSHVVGVTVIYRDKKTEETSKKQKQSLGLDFIPTFAEFEQSILSEGCFAAFAAPTNQTIRFSSVPSDGENKKRDGRKRVSVMQTLQEYLLVYAITYDQFERNQRKMKQRLAMEAAVGSAEMTG